jgi:hypothetical protein
MNRPIIRQTRALIWLVLAAMFWGCGGKDRPDQGPFILEPLEGRVSGEGAEIRIESPSLIQYPDQFVWGGSVVKGEDGRYHMFFSMFDAGPGKPPFRDAWLLSSKIAHAVSDQPHRGFIFQSVILRGAGEEGNPEAWDAQTVHNPHIRKFNGRYYLYYIGSRDPGEQPPGSPGSGLRKRDRIQQVQKIGLITCDSLEDLISGRFARPESPLLSPRTRVKAGDVIDPSPPGTVPGPDNLVVVNPSVVFRPSDGKYLLYFKGNLYDPEWRGVHGVALGDGPAGPFEARDEFVFDLRMPDGRLAKAEDPFVWYHVKSRLFYAVFKDFSGRFTGGPAGLALMRSEDGIRWETAPDPLFSPLELRFTDGTVLSLAHLERPQLLTDDVGNPIAFYAAGSILPVGGKTDGSTFNVQIKTTWRKP